MTDPIIEIIRRRLYKENKNYLAVICGETGSGKSYSGLSLCKAIDDSFNVDRVVFTPSEFIHLLNKGNLEKGNAILWDEAGVGIPAREWYRLSNRLIGYVIQTFRNRNLAVVFTVPTYSFIDKQLRCLFHAFIEVLGVDEREKVVITKYKRIQHSASLGKNYYKYIRLLDEETNKYAIIKRYAIPRPPQELIDAYEKKKEEYVANLGRSIEEKLMKFELSKVENKENELIGVEKEKREVDLKAIADEVKANILDFTSYSRIYKRHYLDKFKIMNKFNIGRFNARRVVTEIKNTEPELLEKLSIFIY